MTFHDSRVGKLDTASNSKPVLAPSPTREVWKSNWPDPMTDPTPAPGTGPSCWWWSNKKADVSSVGKHAPPIPGNRPPGLWGSGFSTGAMATCALPNRTPVTCCTICLKFAGSAVMNVVWVFFDARAFRFVIFPEFGPAIVVVRCRFGIVSGSEPETVETVGVSGAAKGAVKSEASVSVTELIISLPWLLEKVFWRALVRVSVSRA